MLPAVQEPPAETIRQTGLQSHGSIGLPKRRGPSSSPQSRPESFLTKQAVSIGITDMNGIRSFLLLSPFQRQPAGIDGAPALKKQPPGNGISILSKIVSTAAEFRPGVCSGAVAAGILAGGVPAAADTTPLAVLDPTLQAVPFVSGLSQPIGAVFIGPDDMLVLEKASGQVKRVIAGVVQAAPVLDLAVNSNSERGLLSMALHPDFPETPEVFIRWTTSSTGADSNVVSEVPLLGNRIDVFDWERQHACI